MANKTPESSILGGIGGPLFLACTFIGMGIGYVAGSVLIGLVGGIVAGFIAMAVKHKITGD